MGASASRIARLRSRCLVLEETKSLGMEYVSCVNLLSGSLWTVGVCGNMAQERNR